MPLGKIQSQIVAQLLGMNRLTGEQADTIAAAPGEPTGEALDKLLREEYRITSFQLLVAKGRALGLAPCNVARHKITAKTFERIPEDFCQQNLVLPVGEVGEFLLVAFANPFEVAVPAKIQEMTGRKVVRLLAREKDLREKFNKAPEQQTAGFEDVVEKIGAEYGELTVAGADDVTEESGPIIQLANRIIEDAYFGGASDIHVEPQEKDVVVRYRIDGVCSGKAAAAAAGRPGARRAPEDHVQPGHLGAPVAAGRTHRVQAVSRRRTSTSTCACRRRR